MPLAVVSLAASWIASCAARWRGARLAAARRDARARRARARAGARDLLASRPGPVRGVALVAGVARCADAGRRLGDRRPRVAIALALAWARGLWPVVPGAAWALMFSACDRADRATAARDGIAPRRADPLARIAAGQAPPGVGARACRLRADAAGWRGGCPDGAGVAALARAAAGGVRFPVRGEPLRDDIRCRPPTARPTSGCGRSAPACSRPWGANFGIERQRQPWRAHAAHR